MEISLKSSKKLFEDLKSSVWIFGGYKWADGLCWLLIEWRQQDLLYGSWAIKPRCAHPGHGIAYQPMTRHI